MTARSSRYAPDTARASFRHDRLSQALRPDRPLRLAVVADTHAAPHPRLHDHLRAMAPDAILHAGDIGAVDVLDDLAEIAPLFAIRGNIDDPAMAIPDAITLRFTRPASSESPAAPHSVAFSLLLLHIGVAGPRLRNEVGALAQKEGAALVVCGHSHVPFVGTDRGVTIFNPGSIGPRRMHLPIVFGEIAIGERVSFRHVDAVTGETWLPPGV